MALQRRDVRFEIIRKFTVGAVRNACSFAVIPDKTAFRPGGAILAFEHVIPAAISITGHPGFFIKVICIGCCAPTMPIGANLSADIKIVKQHKIAGKCVVIGCNFFRKQTKRGIAVAFRHIAQNLIVGSIFLDDIENVLDGRWIAHTLWDRVAGFAFCQFFAFFCIRRIAVHLPGIFGQCLFIRRLYDTHGPLHQSANVLVFFSALLVINLMLFAQWIRTVWIWKGRKSFSIGNKNFPANNPH